ncbi:hypothetical protein D5047_13490 [Verminephrobacter eiseniae]|nr:hypothetical protein [Verminephrobacter eiseniae]
MAQRIVAAKPVAVAGFDGPGKGEQRRQRHVERILPFASHARGRGVVPLKRLHDIVAQHHVAAVLEDAQLHRCPRIEA